MKNLKIYAVSLGCPKNRVDTERFIGNLIQRLSDSTIVFDPVEADLIVVNTCGFIQEAVEESIEVILELAQVKRPNQKLAVLGCMVERYGEELTRELPEVDYFLGVKDFYKIGHIISALTSAPRESIPENGPLSMDRLITTPPWRAYLKVADGCSNRCTYCLIPRLRGSYRSESFKNILQEAKILSRQGVRELTLVAQDLTAYEHNGRDLSDLISSVSRETDIEWIRLLYLHPHKINDKLLDTINRNNSICRYLDIPIQHASDRVLKLMGRGYSRKTLDHLIEKVRSAVPGAALRTTVMVGFPGEGERDFEILKDMISKWRFDHLGCFIYSDEAEAPSCKIRDKVPKEVAEARKEELMSIQAEISKEKNLSYIGRTYKVLLEGFSPETEMLLVGRMEFQSPEIDGVVYINKGFGDAGDFVNVKITDAHTYDLLGEIV